METLDMEEEHVGVRRRHRYCKGLLSLSRVKYASRNDALSIKVAM